MLHFCQVLNMLRQYAEMQGRRLDVHYDPDMFMGVQGPAPLLNTTEL